MSDLSLSVVVPAYNEESRLGGTLRAGLDFFATMYPDFELIVVDDGSDDGTATLVERFSSTDSRVRLLRLPRNRGKGYAVRTGVLASRGRLVLFMDADGATEMPDFERLRRAIERGAHVAIGSREGGSGNVRVDAKPHRRLIGRTFHHLVRLLAVRGVRDTQCGFKLFTRPVADDLFSRARMDGYVFDVELLLLARRSGYSIQEVPVSWTHRPGSKVRVVRDGLSMLRDLIVMRLRHLSSRRRSAAVVVRL